MSTALITIAHGRHDHLTRQYEALALSTVRPGLLVIVAMDDPEISRLDLAGPSPLVVELGPGESGLPLARARNAGASAALTAGADVLVFLDVDCIPAAALIESYTASAHDPLWTGSLLCGPVSYLPPAEAGGYNLERLDDLAQPHPARPAPAPGSIVAGDDPALFWSLSFAVSVGTWATIGGFPEVYEGYGAEDTDFAMLARAAGVDLAWVGAARAFHQYHPTTTPPVQHLDDIVRNATIYFERWGEWPMSGWLEQFQRSGLVEWTPRALSRTAP
jgi:GT2 family glycosyltransferase